MFWKWFRQWRCDHTTRSWFRNIYGDEIFHSGYKRSVWQCDNCDKWFYEDRLAIEHVPCKCQYISCPHRKPA